MLSYTTQKSLPWLAEKRAYSVTGKTGILLGEQKLPRHYGLR